MIGGSLAKAFRRTNPGIEIICTDSNPDYMNAALKDGVITRACEHLSDAVRGSQVIFLCTPVESIPHLLKELCFLAEPGTIMTDVGSIKEHIMTAACSCLPDNVYYVGGHPMAGTERSGYGASTARLFENAYYVLTPRPGTPDTVVERLTQLISSTGSLPLIMDPGLHDYFVAAVSHLPHVIAAALVNTVGSIDDPDHFIQRLAAGGFKDITRIASSNAEMWKEISLSNRQQLRPLIASIIKNLQLFQEYLDDRKIDEIGQFYAEAKAFRDGLPSVSSLFLLPYYEVYVDVEDKPGIIGQVTTILGNHNVNIKNIRIINSRENEPGCLVLSLPDMKSQEIAITLLTDNGCRAYRK